MTDTVTIKQGQKRNIKVVKGETYDHIYTYADDNGVAIGITGYTARMHIRATVDATTTLYEAVSGGDLTIGGTAGTVTLSIPAATTAAWTFLSGVYDVELVSPAGKVIKLVGVSRVTISPEVTR